MESNVINFANGKPSSGDDKRKSLEESTRQRLGEASQIAKKLKETNKTELRDRNVFARNLGAIWEEAKDSSGLKSLSGVFDAAFGKNGTAQFKKRKRFMLLRGETTIESHQASGRNFAYLAEAIARLAHEGQPQNTIEQAEHRAIIQLIQGTSFDDRRLPEARRRDHATATLIENLEKVVNRVTGSIKLDEIRVSIKNDAVAAVLNEHGDVESLASAGNSTSYSSLHSTFEEVEETNSMPGQTNVGFGNHTVQHDLPKQLLNSWSQAPKASKVLEAQRHLALSKLPNERPVRVSPEDLDDYDDPEESSSGCISYLAPRVTIGDLFSHPSDCFSVKLQIDEEHIEGELDRQATTITRVASDISSESEAPAFNRERAYRALLSAAVTQELARQFGYTNKWIDLECNSLEDLGALIKNNELHRPNEIWKKSMGESICERRRVQLQLLRDYTTGQWRLCLAFVHGVGLGITNREGVFGAKHPGNSFEPSINLGRHGAELCTPSLESATLFLHRVARNQFILYAIQNEDMPEDRVFGVGIGWLPFPSKECLDALFAEVVDGHLECLPFQSSLGDYRSKPAPANPNTLAGMILRNLAYAPEEGRIDLQLLEDAKRRVRMVREFSEKNEAEFRNAILRLDNE